MAMRKVGGEVAERTDSGPAAAATARRASRAERAPSNPTAILLDRVFVIEGARSAQLTSGLAGAGIAARVIAAESVETVIAGVLIAEDGPALPVAVEAMRSVRRRGLAAGLLVLANRSPREVANLLGDAADAVLPTRTPVALVVAQLRALVRLIALDPPSGEPEIITVRGITVDLERREASAGGHPLALTPTEFLLLSLLARKRGVVTHAELFREIHDHDAPPDDMKAVIKVHVWRLRAKLAEAMPDYTAIVNVRGFGYLLERRAPRPRQQPDDDGD